MKENSTRTNLLLYAYNETDLCRSDQVQRLIDGDPLVAVAFKEITETLSFLDTFKALPSEKTIQKILAFSAR